MIKQTSKTNATDPKRTREVYKLVDKRDGEFMLNTTAQKKEL